MGHGRPRLHSKGTPSHTTAPRGNRGRAEVLCAGRDGWPRGSGMSGPRGTGGTEAPGWAVSQGVSLTGPPYPEPACVAPSHTCADRCTEWSLHTYARVPHTPHSLRDCALCVQTGARAVRVCTRARPPTCAHTHVSTRAMRAHGTPVCSVPGGGAENRAEQ